MGAITNIKVSLESILCVNFEFCHQSCSSARYNRESSRFRREFSIAAYFVPPWAKNIWKIPHERKTTEILHVKNFCPSVLKKYKIAKMHILLFSRDASPYSYKLHLKTHENIPLSKAREWFRQVTIKRLLIEKKRKRKQKKEMLPPKSEPVAWNKGSGVRNQRRKK